MEKLAQIVKQIDDVVWGPAMLVLLLGTGVFLTLRTGFLSWRNLGYSIRKTLSKESRQHGDGEGDITPFAALTTALASTIGTGNIVGVATAMVSGGPGALVWMWISAAFGMTSKYAECFLAIKYREVNDQGQIAGGPMYVMKKAFRHKGFGMFLGFCFALFTAIASFGVGNLTQANSISTSLYTTFDIPTKITGVILVVMIFAIVVGGIQYISKVSSIVVPLMALLYMVAGFVVILGNYRNIPSGLAAIFQMAFSVKSVAGGMAGTITASMMNAMRFGVARGIFSNEAGLGSAAITACAAKTKSPAEQAYVNMTGTFWDTIVVCSITGLCIASSGVLGTMDAEGKYVTGAALTVAAFKSVLGETGAILVSVSIALFAFSTILGWEYNGEKALEYLAKGPRFNMIYRLIFSAVAFVGATVSLDIVWNLSDIANALMAIPNLVCLLLLSGEIAREMKAYQSIIQREKENRG